MSEICDICKKTCQSCFSVTAGKGNPFTDKSTMEGAIKGYRVLGRWRVCSDNCLHELKLKYDPFFNANALPGEFVTWQVD